jgi:uncharacterized membrane protein
MSDLVVFTYQHEDKAAEVLKEIGKLKQENVQKALIGIEDAAVAFKTPEGKLKVHQTLESVAKGSTIASGSLWGLLIGLFFGGPLLGALAGGGISWLLGRDVDIGIDNDFIDKVAEDLTPGNSALFMLVKDTDPATLAKTLNMQGGRLYHTSLSDEAAEAFTQAANHEDVQRALAQEYDT